MANKAPSPRKAKHDVAPWVRLNFFKAVREVVRREGKPAHEVMADWLESDPIAMLRVVASYQEKSSLDVRHSGSVEHVERTPEADATSDEVVAGIVDRINRLAAPGGTQDHAPGNGANGSGVPAGGAPGQTRH